MPPSEPPVAHAYYPEPPESNSAFIWCTPEEPECRQRLKATSGTPSVTQEPKPGLDASEPLKPLNGIAAPSPLVKHEREAYRQLPKFVPFLQPSRDTSLRVKYPQIQDHLPKALHVSDLVPHTPLPSPPASCPPPSVTPSQLARLPTHRPNDASVCGTTIVDAYPVYPNAISPAANLNSSPSIHHSPVLSPTHYPGTVSDHVPSVRQPCLSPLPPQALTLARVPTPMHARAPAAAQPPTSTPSPSALTASAPSPASAPTPTPPKVSGRSLSRRSRYKSHHQSLSIAFENRKLPMPVVSPARARAWASGSLAPPDLVSAFARVAPHVPTFGRRGSRGQLPEEDVAEVARSAAAAVKSRYKPYSVRPLVGREDEKRVLPRMKELGPEESEPAPLSPLLPTRGSRKRSLHPAVLHPSGAQVAEVPSPQPKQPEVPIIRVVEPDADTELNGDIHIHSPMPLPWAAKGPEPARSESRAFERDLGGSPFTETEPETESGSECAGE